ncbi:hypothetical protein GP486_003749 [Trichoglossum hirsutum]|uniref:Uncharacterized protein n=1 Tax=Trichoglossum hirsutum TaxID=265104 RepID=A0A9P8LCG2_9PEZI|nr:hypothetical protein GP486_003749 [Trichoglossum hirsutum]
MPQPDYYSELKVPGLELKFVDLDRDDEYVACNRYLRDPETLNFVLDFGTDEAWVAVNVLGNELVGLLAHKRPSALTTRWINIFAPNRQVDVVKALAKHYAFSPRLYGLMCLEPLKPQIVAATEEPPSTTERFKNYARRERQRLRASYDPQSPTAARNPEDPLELRQAAPVSGTKRLDVNHYHIVDGVWHWSSMDYGEKFLCLGYNWLHNVDDGEDENPEEDLKDVPSGRRLWTWLILCDDGATPPSNTFLVQHLSNILGTVISIHEDPFPGQNKLTPDEQTRMNLSIIRRNLLNVFQNLSKAEKARFSSVAEGAISTLHIRKAPGSADGDPSGDSPSLLFYYLFDDWYTTYSLVVRRQHKYGEKLRTLRQELSQKPGLGQLQEIHQIGRQLGVLKRVYTSYKLMIDRIVQGQKPKNKLRQLSRESTSEHYGVHKKGSLNNTSNPVAALGTTLSSSAIVRFQRLGDRVDMYVLSEIQQCLDEKEALVFMVSLIKRELYEDKPQF